jgi:tRNA (guanine37-N1)-methyltransferase
LNIKVVTIFPQAFPSTLGIGLIGKALNKIWTLELIDLKKYGRYLDNRPFGGGNGMVLLPTIMEKVIEENKLENLIFLSPRGKVFNQEMSLRLSELKEISIICGRYEGIDQRVIDYYNIQEISLGDFILCGGESAALSLIESTVRNIPGVLGNKQSILDESFNDFLLEHHHYTQPRVWKGMVVEEVLISGHHKLIENHRYKEALAVTKERREDLFFLHFVSKIIYIFCLFMIKSDASN